MSKESEIAAQALHDAANAWQEGEWAEALLPKPAGEILVLSYAQRMTDWLRARAVRVEQS